MILKWSIVCLIQTKIIDIFWNLSILKEEAMLHGTAGTYWNQRLLIDLCGHLGQVRLTLFHNQNSKSMGPVPAIVISIPVPCVYMIRPGPKSAERVPLGQHK